MLALPPPPPPPPCPRALTSASPNRGHEHAAPLLRPPPPPRCPASTPTSSWAPAGQRSTQALDRVLPPCPRAALCRHFPCIANRPFASLRDPPPQHTDAVCLTFVLNTYAPLAGDTISLWAWLSVPVPLGQIPWQSCSDAHSDSAGLGWRPGFGSASAAQTPAPPPQSPSEQQGLGLPPSVRIRSD